MFSTTITPRTYETDAWGHINNNSICAWFEILRTTFTKDILYDGDRTGPQNWVLATMTIDFLGETEYGSDVELRLTEVTMGSTSMTLKCEMYQDGQQVVRGSSVLVYFDSETRKSRPITEELRSKLPGS